MIKMPKEDVVSLLISNKHDDKPKSYKQLSDITGYTKRHLIRMSKDIIKSNDVNKVITHKNKGRVPSNAACESEIEFIRKFKINYPNITIAQFKDIIDEDIINNPSKRRTVNKYHLKIRSLSFYGRLFKRFNWKSPVKHKRLKSSDYERHPLRKPCARKGELIQIDGTPYEWFDDDIKYCLHLAVDDATSEVLAGYFTKNECLYGYCMMMSILLKKHGIPKATYSDRHQIFKAQDGSYTNFGYAMKDLGVEMIYAQSPQAKGRIERMNFTEQNRLVNDIKRFKVKHDLTSLNEWFNDFYIAYLNKKFSYIPIDPNSEFVPIIDSDFNYNNLFSLRFERKIINKDSLFSFNNHIYVPVNEKTGDIIYIRKDVKINVRFEILTNRVTIIYHDKVYVCKDLGINSKGRRNKVMENAKDLNNYIEELENKK